MRQGANLQAPVCAARGTEGPEEAHPGLATGPGVLSQGSASGRQVPDHGDTGRPGPADSHARPALEKQSSKWRIGIRDALGGGKSALSTNARLSVSRVNSTIARM